MILLQSSATATANPVKTEGLVIKLENQIIISELLLFQKCILPFPPFSSKGLEQPQEGPASLAVTPALHRNCHPARTDRRGKLVFGAQSSGYRSTSVHLFYIFSSPSICHMQGNCSGGSEDGDILSYLARNNNYSYFHYISGGFTTKNK